MSDGHPPAGATQPLDQPGQSRQGWLLRLIRGVVAAALRPDLAQLEGAISTERAASESLRSALERESGARVELQAHLETRLNDSAAAHEDLRGAYVATRSEFEGVRDRRLLDMSAAFDRLAQSAGVLQGELESLRDTRVPRVESDLVLQQKASETIQREVESVRDSRIPRVEGDLGTLQRAVDGLQFTVAGLQALAEELRDHRLPALSGRTDVLVERLHEDLTEVTGLVERLAQHEPLRIEIAPEVEARIPAAVAAASQRFADAFRADRAEILGRAAEHVEALAGHAPVFDVGCGRGELLEALRVAGIEARGVDSDLAMVAACRRIGLAVEQGDAVAALHAEDPGSLGGVSAIHIVEHLPAAGWMTLVEAAAVALRPGGVLLVESPNPESLRVGAGLFWTDPTHRAPVHPDALAFVARAVGLEVVEVRRLHPFPAEQALARPDQPEPVRELASRLDAWLSGPRDILLIARKP